MQFMWDDIRSLKSTQYLFKEIQQQEITSWVFTKYGEFEHDTFACTSIGFNLCKERKSF